MNGGPPGNGHGPLSRRELEVARLVAEGMTNREIAARLFVSERTVDGHLEHVREKLQVNSRAQVAAWVVRLGSGDETVLPPVTAVAIRNPVRVNVRTLRLWVAAALVFSVLALVMIGLVREPPAPRILTIAGTAPIDTTFTRGSFSGDGGPAISAELARPSSIAIGPGGTIYLADYGNRRVRVVAADGTISTVAGSDGGKPLTEDGLATAVHIKFPSTVAFDRQGRLYFLTNQDGALEVWSVTASFVKREASVPPTGYIPNGGWADPVGGLAIGGDGSLYIADSAGNRVWSVSPGREPTVLAGTGVAGFEGDTGPASAAMLDAPVGLALDRQGRYLYVADVGNDRIRRIDLQSRIIITFAGSGDTFGDSGDGGLATSARLKIPFGVAVAPDGNVYIADTGNNRIRKVTPAGVIVAVAGNGVVGFAGDGGPAVGAQLAGPEAVIVAPNGDLIVADTFNQRIRRVYLSQ